MNKKNIIDKWKEHKVSWSQLSSWNFNKHQWASRYLFCEPSTPNAKMVFGNTVGDSLATPNSMMPELDPYLDGIKEYKLETTMNGLNLIGYADHYCPQRRVLNENKTSTNPVQWHQKKVDEHGQLTMYALILLLEEKVKPENIEMWLNFIPVNEKRYGVLELPEQPTFLRFPTKRTTKQVLLFGAQIKKTLEDMEKYAHKLIDKQ